MIDEEETDSTEESAMIRNQWSNSDFNSDSSSDFNSESQTVCDSDDLIDETRVN